MKSANDKKYCMMYQKVTCIATKQVKALHVSTVSTRGTRVDVTSLCWGKLNTVLILEAHLTSCMGWNQTHIAQMHPN